MTKLTSMHQHKTELELFSPADFGEKGEAETKSLPPTLPADIASLFLRLSHSRFRSSFYLNSKDSEIVFHKGLTTIRKHAQEIIAKRLAPAFIPNDGKQTPMRHGTSPVFIAQHATGCCCRGCLEKWHHIPKGRALTPQEQNHIVDIILYWIEEQLRHFSRI